MSQGIKAAEGEEHVKKAEKYLKTSMLKWSPDYDSAGDEFSRAATCFKVVKDYDRTLDALDRACECYKQINSLYQAAKMLEQAVLVCRDSGRFDKVEGFASRGGLLYRQHGSAESAAQLLEKAAKILEANQNRDADALSLYVKAAETIATEDRPKEASEYLTKVARLQTKMKDLDQAALTLKQAIDLQQGCGHTALTGRLVGALVLVHLAREDTVAAERTFSEMGGWCDVDLSSAVRTTLRGFDESDAEVVKEGLNSSAIKNLDIEFARLAARGVPLPDVGSLEAAASQFGQQRDAAIKDAQPAKPVPAAPAAAVRNERSTPEKAVEEAKKLEQEDDGEDDEDGLC